MDQFLSLETLKTFAGSVAAVLVLVQIIKQVIPSSWDAQPADVLKRSLTVVASVGLQGFLAWNDGATAGGFVLAFVNGLGVALAAMKAYEIMPSMGSPARMIAIPILVALAASGCTGGLVEIPVLNAAGQGALMGLGAGYFGSRLLSQPQQSAQPAIAPDQTLSIMKDAKGCIIFGGAKGKCEVSQ